MRRQMCACRRRQLARLGGACSGGVLSLSIPEAKGDPWPQIAFTNDSEESPVSEGQGERPRGSFVEVPTATSYRWLSRCLMEFKFDNFEFWPNPCQKSRVPPPAKGGFHPPAGYTYI